MNDFVVETLYFLATTYENGIWSHVSLNKDLMDRQGNKYYPCDECTKDFESDTTIFHLDERSCL